MEFQIEHITKKYKKYMVLQDVTFSAKSGECIGILGGNGSGKSTLLNILGGVLAPNGGRFMHQETDLFKDHKQRASLLGYVPQSTPLFDELSALDNLRLWYDNATLRSALSDGVLTMLGIHEFLHTQVSRMSGGMKKRLSIGCAVAGHPKILLLDEPSAALDLVCKEKITAYLLNYKAQGGTIILATHDVQELSLCDKLFILKGGTLVPYEYDGNIHALVGSLQS